MKTLAEIYHNSVSQYTDRTCHAMWERDSITYGDFDRLTRELQHTLLSAGLTAGDKIALLSSNMPTWPVCYFAVVEMGMVVVPILPGFSGEEFDQIIKHSEAKGLLVSDKLYSKLSRETIESQQIVIRTKNLGVIHQNHAPEVKPGRRHTPTPEDTAAIIYTSGTTSAPKGVMLSHGALAAQVEIANDVFPARSDDVFLSILPLSHTYECSIGMLYPFTYGASVYYLDRPPTPSTLMPAMKEIRPTIMLSVPLIMDKIYKNQVLAKFTANAVWRWFYARGFFRRLLHRLAGKKLYKLFGGKLRFFGIGGAKLDSQTEQFLLEAKFPYAIGYGLTETAPLLAGAAPSMVRLGTTGPAVKDVTLRIDNPNAEGEGELVALSPCVMQGYFKNPEKSAEAFTADGWFRTGDLAAIADDGYVSIKGRLGSMLVSPSGENIYPEEIESILNSLVFVSDSIVTEDHKGKLIALVRFNYDELEHRYHALRENLAHRMEEIRREVMTYVNGRVASFSRLTEVREQPEDFEKTPSMKIKRFKYARRRGN